MYILLIIKKIMDSNHNNYKYHVKIEIYHQNIHIKREKNVNEFNEIVARES